MGFIINPYQFVVAAGYLLDTYTGATAAFGLRQLKSTATVCIRVRRSSDNSELDIGFDGSGNLDTSAIDTHCSGTDGFIAKWYDQEGTNHAVRTVAADQPKICASGTTITDPDNGNPAMFCDGTSDFFDLTSTISTTQLFYLSVVFNRPTTSTVGATLSDNSTTPYPFYWRNINAINDGMGGVTTTHDTDTSTGDFIFTFLRDSSDDLKYWKNGSAGTTKNVTDAGGVFDRILTRNTNYHDGYYQELIYWNSDQESNRSGIETDTNSYYSIF